MKPYSQFLLKSEYQDNPPAMQPIILIIPGLQVSLDRVNLLNFIHNALPAQRSLYRESR